MVLIFAISFGFSTVVDSVESLIFFLVSALIGVDLYKSSQGFFKERTLVFCLYFFSTYGYFLDYFLGQTPLHFLGVIFLGIGTGGIFCIFTKNFFYRYLKAQTHTDNRHYFITLSLCPVLCLFMSIYVEYSNFICNLILSIMGLIACYVLPIYSKSTVPHAQKEHKTHEKNRLKISVFFFLIALAASITWCVNVKNQPFQGNYQYNNIMLIGLLLGPIITLPFVNKKGIYSGCILLIFLSEISLMSISLYNHMTYGPLIGNFTYGLLLTSTLTLYPILTYYMLGPYSFLSNCAKMTKTIIVGFLPVLPLSKLSWEFINSTEVTLTTICLLLGGFFTVFSAWNHRLVLLK